VRVPRSLRATHPPLPFSPHPVEREGKRGRKKRKNERERDREREGEN